METEYCPNCIEELIINRKKLGDFTIWLVCPICGFRKRPDTNNYEANNLVNRIKERNKNRNKFNTYEEE